MRLVARHRARRHVHLDVVPTDLALEVLQVQLSQHGSVDQRRIQVVVHEVELDLKAHLRSGEVEPLLLQHPLEDVQVLEHLLAVAQPLLAGECR